MKIARVFAADGRRVFVEPENEKSGQELKRSKEFGFVGTGKQVGIASYLAPVDPKCIFGIGANYRDHADEVGRELPSLPMIFIKAGSALSSHGKAIEIPVGQKSTKVDYEGELAVVIGKAAKNVSIDEALNYVFGYTIANDVSARDWQWEYGQGQFCQGKSFDTFCPLGPVIATREEIPDPQSLRIRTHVNGELRQDGSTGDMIFPVAELISFLSGSKTLQPGTIILTGTPRGVGAAMDPPSFLQPGDRVRIEIDGIGTLENPVSAEQVR